MFLQIFRTCWTMNAQLIHGKKPWFFNGVNLGKAIVKLVFSTTLCHGQETTADPRPNNDSGLNWVCAGARTRSGLDFFWLTTAYPAIKAISKIGFYDIMDKKQLTADPYMSKYAGN